MAEERYALIAEWYDPQAALVRRYQMLYYSGDGTVEMFDIKNRRAFLRRTTVENLKPSDLYIGNTVNILSRQLTLVEFGDDFTRQRLGSRAERTFALVKPAAVAKLGEILQAAATAGLTVANLRMCSLDRAEAMEFYREHEGKAFLPSLLASITSGPVVAMELLGASAVDTWRQLIGPTDPGRARQEAPSSLRARFGQDATSNALHGADSEAAAARELAFFFPQGGQQRASSSSSGSGPNCTCCIVRPHAVADGSLGGIFAAIAEAGFSISAVGMFRLDKACAEEFLEVYKGVVAEYNSMLVELCSGPCVAMEIVGDADVYKSFREFCGPSDPEIARHLRPRSLRARFGRDKVQNAVHCTDLPEDTQLEVQYFFQILSN